MAVNLYEYQKNAVERMRPGCILCGGVGTGKSITSLAYYVKYICNGSYSRKGSRSGVELGRPVPLYIITTARKRDTFEWDAELSHFLLSQDPDISKAFVKVDSWNNIAKYTDVSGAFFIFDEHHLVGKGSWSKSFLKIAKKNKWVVLTATPGDVWFDYWAIFVANGFYKNLTDFTTQHVIFQRFAKFPKIERYVGTRKLERLRDSILISMDCEKVATRHHTYVKAGYDDDIYKIVSKKRWNVEENRPIESVSEACHLMRKIVNSDPRRIECVRDILKNHPRSIIFYNFNYELEMLKGMCEEDRILYAEWNGHKHQPIPKGSKWVYLVQYTSGSEGWNCVETDTIIFYSMNYSYKCLEQSCGRIDRINTPFTDLYYYHIFSDSSIDFAIRKCVKNKKDFNEKAFFTSL